MQIKKNIRKPKGNGLDFKLRTAELVLELKMLKCDLGSHWITATFEKRASLSVLIMISLMLIGEVIYPVDI